MDNAPLLVDAVTEIEMPEFPFDERLPPRLEVVALVNQGYHALLEGDETGGTRLLERALDLDESAPPIEIGDASFREGAGALIAEYTSVARFLLLERRLAVELKGAGSDTTASEVESRVHRCLQVFVDAHAQGLDQPLKAVLAYRLPLVIAAHVRRHCNAARGLKSSNPAFIREANRIQAGTESDLRALVARFGRSPENFMSALPDTVPEHMVSVVLAKADLARVVEDWRRLGLLD